LVRAPQPKLVSGSGGIPALRADKAGRTAPKNARRCLGACLYDERNVRRAGAFTSFAPLRGFYGEGCMELCMVFASLVIMVGATVYWSNEARRNRRGFPKSRNKGRKTFIAWICGMEG
jgi:hypothetical protein